MRLIDADALLKTGSGIKIGIPNYCHAYEAIRIQGNAFRKAVEEAPTVDAVPVVHGEWGEKLLDNFMKVAVTCSVCGWMGIDNYDAYIAPGLFNYCPNCGADMRGAEDGC